MAPYVFICYRRNDDRFAVELLVEALQRDLGEDAVFVDEGSIKPGGDYPTVIRESLAGIESVLVVIGENWEPERLVDPADDVRLEIETAFSSGKFVLPVLVGLASIPDPTQLPESLGALCLRQAARLRPGLDFDGDSARIVAAVRTASPATLTIDLEPVRLMFGKYEIKLDGESVARGSLGKGAKLAAQRIDFGTHTVSVRSYAVGGIGNDTDHSIAIDQSGSYHLVLRYQRRAARTTADLS
jgi:hypothetical protein